MSLSRRAAARWAARGRTGAPPDGGGGGPLSVTTEVHVARSAQAVWDLMEDAAAVRQVDPRVLSLEPVAGTGPGIGRTYGSVHQVGGARRFASTRVTAEQPPRFQEEVCRVDGQPDVRARRWIEHTGTGCRVVWQVEVDLPPHVTPEQRAAVERSQREDLERLGERWRVLAETGTLPDPEPPAA